MHLVRSFVLFLQPLAAAMTRPSLDNAMTRLTGRVFAPRRTVAAMVVAAGAFGRKHHSPFHRLFATARWSRDQLGLAVFELMTPWLGNSVVLAADGTLAHKRGLNILSVGMHRDPILSSRGKAITRWEQSWVVLGVIVRFPLLAGAYFLLADSVPSQHE